MDNSIKLKELQVVTGALKKKGRGIRIVFFFQKGFLGWGVEDGVIPPFSKVGFFKRLR